MTTFATLTLSNGRSVQLPEQFALVIRKQIWNDALDIGAMPNVSIVKSWLYGWNRIVNDAAGSGTRAEQQEAARDRLADLYAGNVSVNRTRKPANELLSTAINIAIELVVRGEFKSKGKKLVRKDMEARAIELIKNDKRFVERAKARIEEKRRQTEADRAFFADTPVDSDVMALLDAPDEENDPDDIIDSAEIAAE